VKHGPAVFSLQFCATAGTLLRVPPFKPVSLRSSGPPEADGTPLGSRHLDITRGQSFRDTHGELLELITDAGFTWTSETFHARRVPPPDCLIPRSRQERAERRRGSQHAITCASETLGPAPVGKSASLPCASALRKLFRFAHNFVQLAKQFALLSNKQPRVANGVNEQDVADL
jgi:hypothetical protein